MKKIGEIKGVPVVEGDANLVKNQILYKETGKGISLSKRTNGKLEEVSGGNGSTQNADGVLYYKVVKSDEEVNFMNETMTCYELVKIYNQFPHMAQFVSMILINPETNKCEKFYKEIHTTSSGDITTIGKVDDIITHALYGDMLKGFSICKEETLFHLVRSNNKRVVLKIKEGTIIDKLVSLTELYDDTEYLEIFMTAFEKCFIPISKEEYNNLLEN